MIEKRKIFNWTKPRIRAAEALSDGETVKVAADKSGLSTSTIDRLKRKPEFAEEVGRLTLMMGIASKAERLRIAKIVVREKMKGGMVTTKKDILEWIQFAAKETDEIRLNLADLIGSYITAKREEDASVSEEGPGRSDTEDSGK